MLPRLLAQNPEKPGQMALLSECAAATAGFGDLLAGLLQSDDVLSLDGDLGAGKTVLVRGLAAGLNCLGPVASPTFVLLMEHPAAAGGLALYHFDAYRLAGSADFCLAGLDEYFAAGGVCAVEWGSLIADLLPEHTLWICLKQTGPEQPEQRRIELFWPGCPERLEELAGRLSSAWGRDFPC